MTKVRVVEDGNAYGAYEDGEYYATCNECMIELAVTPPPSVMAKVKRGIEKDDMELMEAGEDYVSEHYFYCPKCQKDLDVDAVD